MRHTRKKGLAATLAAALILGTMTIGASPAAAEPSVTAFTETFDAPVAVSDAKASSTWYTDRYRPAAFESTTVAGEPCLRIGIDAADSSANRPAAYSGGFYNTQGRKFDLGNPVGTYIAADLYLDSEFATEQRRTDLWGTTVDNAAGISGYPIIGFVNDPTDAVTENDATFRVFTQDTDQDTSNGYQSGWVQVAPAAGLRYDAWHRLAILLTPTAYEFYIDGELVFTDTVIEGSTGFSDMMLQAYNYGSSYDVYWDNASAQMATPPVTTIASVTSLAGKATLKLDAKGPGVIWTKYRVDRGPWLDGDEITLQRLGSHTIEFASANVVGQREAVKTVGVSVWGSSALTLAPPAVAPSWGGSAVMTVKLASSAGLVSAESFDGVSGVIESFDGTGWVKVADVALGPDGTGTATISGIKGALKLRARLEEQAPFTAATTGVATVKPYAFLSRPKISATKIAKGSQFKVSALMKSPHPAGSRAGYFAFERLETQKGGAKKWVRRAFVPATATTVGGYSRLTVSKRLNGSGAWRVRLLHAADAMNVATVSGGRGFTVR